MNAIDLPDRNKPRSVLGVLDLMAKAVVLFTLIGYIGYRSEANHLGIAALEPLSSASLLMHAYRTFIYITGFVLRPIVALAVILPCLMLGEFNQARKVKRVVFQNAIQQFVFSQRFFSFLNVWLAASLLIVNSRLVSLHAELPQELLVGDLSTSYLEWIAGHDASPWELSVLLWSVLLSVVAVTFARKRAPKLRLNATFLLIGLALAVVFPLAYGYLVPQLAYPIAEAHEKDGKAQCGLMILETDSQLGLWRLNGSKGSIVIIPRASAASMSVGRLTNIQADIMRAVGMKEYPDCSELNP